MLKLYMFVWRTTTILFEVNENNTTRVPRLYVGWNAEQCLRTQDTSQCNTFISSHVLLTLKNFWCLWRMLLVRDNCWLSLKSFYKPQNQIRISEIPTVSELLQHTCWRTAHEVGAERKSLRTWHDGQTCSYTTSKHAAVPSLETTSNTNRLRKNNDTFKGYS